MHTAIINNVILSLTLFSRACLKDVPDNLIFHLKRFDFNLRTLTRSKINDHFAFPSKIDMRPYKVEYLSDNSEKCPEDIFELVGILVHSGTAESGHYYSYTRERPSDGDREHWVEFNDDLVSTWDPSFMESACFGGYEVRSTLDSGNMQFDKIHSAYMLFYQRSSVLALQKQEMVSNKLQSPVRLEVPPASAQQIGEENELLIRKYCLYDPSHASFVTKMLGNMKVINKGSCSPDHGMEKLALTTALNHLDQVFARTKDLPDFPTFMLTLRQLCLSCAECSRDFLEWFCDSPEALRHQLLRNPDSQVRSEIANLVFVALNKVKNEATYAYGFGEDESEDDAEDDPNPPRVIQRLVHVLNKLWDVFEKNIRAWPEYFGLLASIAGMGLPEAALLLDVGYLRKSLEIICADPAIQMAPQYMRMNNIINKRLPARPVSYEGVINLLWRLFSVCEPFMEAVADDQERFEASLNGGQIPISFSERSYLIQHWTRGDRLILVEKLLRINQNIPTTRMIISRLLQWPEALDPFILGAISYGIRKASVNAPTGPFLRAAIFYCQHSDNSQAVRVLLRDACVALGATDSTFIEGREFIRFFRDIYDMPANGKFTEDELHKLCLEMIPRWAPALLTYYDGVARQDVEDFMNEAIFEKPPTVGLEGEGDVEEVHPVVIAARQLGIACLEHIDETYIRRRVQAVRVVVLNIQRVVEACESFFEEDDEDDATQQFDSLRKGKTLSPCVFILRLTTISCHSKIKAVHR
jgi:ubiquitin carboxyl-terminal hydrolase 34